MSDQKVSRRSFLQGASSVALASATGLAFDETGATPWRGRGDRPNVIFILADDLGYGDLSVYGRREYSTPNLDALARAGTLLTQAYSSSAVCTPTRVAFTTGRYQQRLPIGIEEPLGWRSTVADRVGLDPEHPTIASLLQANAYRTALIGKWHLGYLPRFSPLKSGYEEFFGIFSGGVDYFTHRDGAGEPDLYEDEVPVEHVGYITDLITERAVRYIEHRAADREPFYLSLHYTAPHWPWEGPNDEEVSRTLTNLVHDDGGSLKTYAEMVRRLDQGIGRVLATLVRAELSDNTLVIFTSDNGGERFSYHWPFFGQKGDLWEGGIRVPAIVRWPGVVPEGKRSAQVAVTLDWTATILAATSTPEAAAFPLDGGNLLPVLTGRSAPVERRLFWRMRDHAAARIGDLKYLKTGGNEYLFDLKADRRERANLVQKRPGDFTRLQQAYSEWNAQMLPYT
jgi:arylsulfatase A-like enzyme